MGFPARANAETPRLFTGIGTNGDPAKAKGLKEQGLDFFTGGTGPILVPEKPEADFAANLKAIQDCPLPMPACNGFIRPPHLRCVGEEANHDQVLEWADTCFRRLKLAGGKFMVFGSGGSRALRKNWTKEQADPQFVALLKRMGPLAEKHGVTVVVEQLNTRECNYINHIRDAADLIRQANHPNIRLLADLYHMAVDGDTPEDLKAAMDVIVHVEIAEKEGRAYPGIGGQDFRPFFRVLRDAKYRG
ncbi:MAG TPA: sugar phosphate isomerase/epimerase family protein, partial [Luteolibacter sp.]|nr:sugar phosphate isomerase/epimerase family protein [Luteolibacter sp.]